MEPCQVLHRDAEQQLASTSTVLRRLHRIPSKPREQEEWRSGAPAAPPPPSTATGENKMSSLCVEFPASSMLLMKETFAERCLGVRGVRRSWLRTVLGCSQKGKALEPFAEGGGRQVEGGPLADGRQHKTADDGAFGR